MLHVCRFMFHSMQRRFSIKTKSVCLKNIDTPYRHLKLSNKEPETVLTKFHNHTTVSAQPYFILAIQGHEMIEA